MMARTKLVSEFAEHIEGFLNQKHAGGYVYGTEELILREFDRFASSRFPGAAELNRDIYMAWIAQKETEGLNARARRASVVKQLSEYMRALGVNAYLPHDRFSTEASFARVMSADELKAFFTEVDKGRGHPSALMYDIEFQVLFRLLYCCGLRLNEACRLEWRDVDLDLARLMIRRSKSRKDRIVYMADDLAQLLGAYRRRMGEFVESRWVFPGNKADAHILKTSVCRVFRQIWRRTPFANTGSKRPTSHSLRHGFVVDRMNDWMLEGVDLATRTPYLSMYLGHRSMDETFYYYHQANKAYQVIRKCDSSSGLVIPEVNVNE